MSLKLVAPRHYESEQGVEWGVRRADLKSGSLRKPVRKSSGFIRDRLASDCDYLELLQWLTYSPELVGRDSILPKLEVLSVKEPLLPGDWVVTDYELWESWSPVGGRV